MWRTNSRSTASRSSRIGSKICPRSAESGEFCIVSAKKVLPGKDRFTILELLAECQRAKPLLLSSFRQSSEERHEIAGHPRGEIDERYAPDLGQLGDNFGNIGRFVPFAAVRDRREKRGIRLSEDAICRNHPRGRAD